LEPSLISSTTSVRHLLSSTIPNLGTSLISRTTTEQSSIPRSLSSYVIRLCPIICPCFSPSSVCSHELARYLRSVLKQLGFHQTKPTVIFIDNLSALKIINDNTSPTDRTRHMDLRFFAIQDWREAGDIVMSHIAGILNPSDDLTKPLGWVLHSRHCRRIMGHYG
jgi:hypothetical protein